MSGWEALRLPLVTHASGIFSGFTLSSRYLRTKKIGFAHGFVNVRVLYACIKDGTGCNWSGWYGVYPFWVDVDVRECFANLLRGQSRLGVMMELGRCICRVVQDSMLALRDLRFAAARAGNTDLPTHVCVYFPHVSIFSALVTF